MDRGYWTGGLRWIAAVVLALTALGWGTARAETTVPVCIAPGAGTAATVARLPARFDCDTPQVAWGPGDYWAMSRSVPPGLGRVPALVRSYSLWQDGLDVWALYADGRLLRLPLARGVPSIGTAIEHLLPGRAVPVTRLLWRVTGAQNVRGIVLGVRVTGLAEQAHASIDSAAIGGWVAGLCAGLLFFNVALWMALRRPFQLAYCAMVAGFLLYTVASAGFVDRLFPALGPLVELRITGFTFILCIVGGMWFARSFLEERVLGRRGDLMVRATSLTLLALAVAREALAPWQAHAIDLLQGTALLGVLVATGFMATLAWTRASQYRRIWPVTVIVPALLAAMRAANTFQIGVRPFAMQQWMLGAMTAGIVSSSLAIAYRIHLLGRERDEARTQEIAARLLADTDPLTGLMNRRSFLHQAIGREGAQLLLIVDLDHFKAINETIGHDGGDEVLRLVARTLATALPPDALIARIGGEEFAVVAAASSSVSPRLIVDALRGQRMPYDLAVTASIGTCTGPLLRETDWKQLYRQADRALYAAKAAGRDRVRDAGMLPLAA